MELIISRGWEVVLMKTNILAEGYANEGGSAVTHLCGGVGPHRLNTLRYPFVFPSLFLLLLLLHSSSRFLPVRGKQPLFSETTHEVSKRGNEEIHNNNGVLIQSKTFTKHYTPK